VCREPKDQEAFYPFSGRKSGANLVFKMLWLNPNVSNSLDNMPNLKGYLQKLNVGQPYDPK
jgi:hypothetical protein